MRMVYTPAVRKIVRREQRQRMAKAFVVMVGKAITLCVVIGVWLSLG